jgi:hypothetical protein
MYNQTDTLRSKTSGTVRNAAMLLLLRRMLMVTVTFCAFQKNRDPTAAEKKSREQQSLRERQEHV